VIARSHSSISGIDEAPIGHRTPGAEGRAAGGELTAPIGASAIVHTRRLGQGLDAEPRT